MTTLLRAENLNFRHPQSESFAFTGVGFTLNAGELLLLCGRNGSGKSTLLETLAGLHDGLLGSLTLFDHPLREGEVPPRELRRRTALLTQNADMQIFGDTVEEDLGLGLSPEEATKAPALAARLGLPALHTRVQHLSYGQKRKLCLATALLRRPDILLLDEPQAGLDYPALKEFYVLLKGLLLEGTAVILATHDPEPFLPAAANLLFLHPEGGGALYGPKEKLLPEAESFGIHPPGTGLDEEL